MPIVLDVIGEIASSYAVQRLVWPARKMFLQSKNINKLLMFFHACLTSYGDGVHWIQLRWLLVEFRFVNVNEGAVNRCDPNYAHFWFHPAFSTYMFLLAGKEQRHKFRGIRHIFRLFLTILRHITNESWFSTSDLRNGVSFISVYDFSIFMHVFFSLIWTIKNLSFPSFKSKKSLRRRCSYRRIATRSWLLGLHGWTTFRSSTDEIFETLTWNNKTR